MRARLHRPHRGLCTLIINASCITICIDSPAVLPPSLLSPLLSQIWVTEFANWHVASDYTVDTPEKQKSHMTSMVKTCEERDDVVRYAWFTGRWTEGGDPRYTSLFNTADGSLSDVGQHYKTLPYTVTAPSPPPPVPPPEPPPPPPMPPNTPHHSETCSKPDEPGWQCVCCLERGCSYTTSMPQMCEAKRCCSRIEDDAYNPEACCGPAGY